MVQQCLRYACYFVGLPVTRACCKPLFDVEDCSAICKTERTKRGSIYLPDLNLRKEGSCSTLWVDVIAKIVYVYLETGDLIHSIGITMGAM